MGTLLLRFQQLRNVAAEFKRGTTSLEDDPLEGRPKSTTTPEIIEQVHDMVLDERRIKVRKRSPCYPLNKKLSRFHSLCRFGEEKDLSFLWEIEPLYFGCPGRSLVTVLTELARFPNLHVMGRMRSEQGV